MFYLLGFARVAATTDPRQSSHPPAEHHRSWGGCRWGCCSPVRSFCAVLLCGPSAGAGAVAELGCNGGGLGAAGWGTNARAAVDPDKARVRSRRASSTTQPCEEQRGFVDRDCLEVPSLESTRHLHRVGGVFRCGSLSQVLSGS